MKTTTYNPSPLEVKFAEAIESMKDQLEEEINISIEKIKSHTDMDNPSLVFHFKDQDSDPHIITIRIIQRPDPH